MADRIVELETKLSELIAQDRALQDGSLRGANSTAPSTTTSAAKSSPHELDLTVNFAMGKSN